MPRQPVVIPQGAFGGNTTPAANQRQPPQTIPLNGAAVAREMVDDHQVSQITENIRRAVGPIKALPFGDGNMLRDVQLVSASNNVLKHALGRPYRGYSVYRVRNIAVLANVLNIQETANPGAQTSGRAGAIGASPLDSQQITLQASQNCTADIWVY